MRVEDSKTYAPTINEINNRSNLDVSSRAYKMAGSSGVAKKIFKGHKTPGMNSQGPADRLEHIREKYRPPGRIEDGSWGGGQTLGGNNAPINMDRRFPVEVGRADPHDKLFDIKRQYVQGSLLDPEGKQIKPNDLGQAIFDESDKNYLADKEKQRIEAEYESFASSVFNLDDPATAALVGEKILPDFYKKREAEIEKQAELQTRLAMIRLRGYPKDAKELSLAFAIQKGLIQLPEGSIWDPSSWAAKKADLARGFFNPFRYTLGRAKLYNNVDSIFKPNGSTAGPSWARPGVGRTNMSYIG